MVYFLFNFIDNSRERNKKCRGVQLKER